ncbi:MAG: universal stress protein [Pseudomonadota bacterium]
MAKRVARSVIIVGYDGSEASLKAVHFAKILARRHDADMHLLHVIDWSPFEYYTLEETAAQARERKAQIREDRESLFPPVVADIEKADIAASSEVVFGNPPQVVARTAKKMNALMVVVGRRGTSRLRRLLMGSVASSVANHAECPVVVVP